MTTPDTRPTIAPQVGKRYVRRDGRGSEDEEMTTPAKPCPPENEWETPCPARTDGQHCDHWYDGGKCCACGDPAERKEPQP